MMKTYKQNHPLLLSVLEALAESKKPATNIAIEAGYEADSIYRIRRADHVPSILKVHAMLNVVGYELVVRKKKPD